MNVRWVAVMVGSTLALGAGWLLVRSRGVEAQALAGVRPSTVEHVHATLHDHGLTIHSELPRAEKAPRHSQSTSAVDPAAVDLAAVGEPEEFEVDDLPEPHHPELRRWARGRLDPRAGATLHAHLDERIDAIGLSGELEEVSCRDGLCRLRLRMRDLAEARALDDELGGPGHRRWMKLSPGHRGLQIDVVVDQLELTAAPAPELAGHP
jgi:hypothetical protein